MSAEPPYLDELYGKSGAEITLSVAPRGLGNSKKTQANHDL
jgi:hypothetical protein